MHDSLQDFSGAGADGRAGNPRPVYLDGHATTPLAPESHAAMEPWWHAQAGNPNSPHRHGQYADAAVEAARGHVAALIGAMPGEIHFTSGATEANNLAIVGSALAALARGERRRGIVVSQIEHKSVLNAAHALERDGFTVTELPVTNKGVIALERASAAISDDTLLVSVMAANNEIGAVQPVAEIADIARARGALVHVDGAQLAGKLPFVAGSFDLVSLSSHKMYGPMGIGALYVSGAAPYRPRPILYGGDQEGGLRPGTLPTPLIAGFGAAAKVAAERLDADIRHSAALAGRFEEELRSRQVRFIRHGSNAARLPGSVSMAFEGVDANELIAMVSAEISISEGSACQSGQITHSHVLRAIELSDNLIKSTVRLYFGRYNTTDHAVLAAVSIASAVRRLQGRTGDFLQ
ncbi:cysteine desulfurase family protein [Mesorhizobium sp.]|uniref:cysteine desulfurase family protein n=1 Tax=Mesorhizobium sp. TaxID=1871066 RepID=UPI000FE8DD9A|nr:cysteine desulfurase family protein [Mesorhizobium sp.]RWI16689.1 MAG: cysteine desulfurase [Mesorhizobium sp.]RWN08821.1 MAG: cysteine desulfurase [Mesorhizobium sp.]RWN16246.1 MAG: cysteine desulfurase [Mesorhizobium sp.]TIQ97451.1 MAG: cysteine desulfurase [Mesorhizobium sp.]